jgi:integrase
VSAYKASPGFKSLALKTRHEYASYVDIICKDWGPLPVSGIRRKHILALRDKHMETPSKANKLVTVLRIVLAFAIDREEIATNPARDIKKLKTGDGHSAWPETAIERFVEVAPPMMALALKLGLYTGQREGDCLSMSWHDDDGEQIYVAQNKTGTKLWIPVHSALRGALDAEKRVSPIILTTTTGKPFTGSNFRHHFGKTMKAAGLEGLTFHGLRYTAAKMLAEAGCSLKEIAAITGHRSLAMIEKYSREADQRKLAGAAIHRLENVSGTKNGKPR